MTGNPFVFDSVIFNGFDDTADGIGNHLRLFDSLIFDDLAPTRKSLSPIVVGSSPYRYGKVAVERHLEYPARFANALFFDVARETWDSARIHRQITKTIQHKRVFGAVTGVYLMWESDRLWDLYGELISVYDFCVVTSSLLDGYLCARGIDHLKLPHPYDFARAAGAPAARRRGDRVRFGVSAGLWRRKNVALLARVFEDVLGDDDRAELSIHTRSDTGHPDFKEEFAAILRLKERGARIEIVDRVLSRPAYLDWMSSLDVYCFLSSGEGYSVTPREALHLGIPVILHDAHVHREFSDLPGVLRVPSRARKKAEPNTSAASYDIGHDCQVDENALADALRYCGDHHLALRREIVERYQEILGRHDIGAIKARWIAALNDRYRCYAGDVRLSYPGVAENPLSTTALGSINLCSGDFHNATGCMVDGRVICVRAAHAPGHCLYGPYVRAPRAGRYQVIFSIVLLSRDCPDEIAVLDIYDAAADQIIDIRRATADAFLHDRAEFTLPLSPRPDQLLEFRVFWPGTADICIAEVRVERLDDAPRSEPRSGAVQP